MNAERLLNLILRRLGRRAINKGLSKGIDVAARKGKPEKQMTPEERQQAKSARQAAKRARQAARLTRRMGKF